MPAADHFDLDRFVAAQAVNYTQACAELRAGRKTSHWMWYVFPQLRGLGTSSTAHRYGITGLPEARAYLDHPVLGPRLVETTGLVLAVRGRTLREILGVPDDVKFRSSMTLFSTATPDEAGAAFRRALDVYCEGQPDPATLRLLAPLA